MAAEADGNTLLHMAAQLQAWPARPPQHPLWSAQHAREGLTSKS